MKTVLLTGGHSGLGKAIAERMFRASGEFLIIAPTMEEMDVRDIDKIREFKSNMSNESLDIIINCAGINRLAPIYPAYGDDDISGIWDDVMDTNARGIFNTCCAFIYELSRAKGTILNVVSNACRVPMTHSLVYNASKAAAEMMTRQMARELTKDKGITVFGINPNKLEGTAMSREIEKRVLELRNLTEEEAKKYQLAALPAGMETKPEWIAELVVWLLQEKHRHEYLTGCLLDLGGP